MTLSSPPDPSGFMADLGIERTVWKPGHSRLELTLADEHLNKGGVAHGGIHMVLLDSALGSALVASLKVEEWCATTQLS
ncbi:MAG: PaaI family thioesterase, partial [Candidatus Thermoplasmatota archaeon]|nr:PaaI family thioesterase [Candidatus Thermoplasmatota archaeon]